MSGNELKCCVCGHIFDGNKENIFLVGGSCVQYPTYEDKKHFYISKLTRKEYCGICNYK